MDRKSFLKPSLGVVAASIAGGSKASAAGEPDCAKEIEQAKNKNAFVSAWLDDLFQAIESDVDQPTRVRLLEACGCGCYRRYPFKQEIARNVAGSRENLQRAYHVNFESSIEDGALHIRHGAVSNGRYCPAAKNRPARPHDVH